MASADQIGAQDDTGAFDRSQRGAAVPRDRFADGAGQPVTLAQFKGKPLLVNLWATWCGPCVKELPALDRLAVRAGDAMTVVIVNEDTSAQAIDPVPAWWAAHKPATLALYRDEKNALLDAFASGQLPTTVLYDKNGKEIWRVIGGVDWDGPRARAMLSDAGI
jgi:thiol-disulfide isomerase/thioredoxin